MTESGKRTSRSTVPRAAGFTLIEILLVIALIAMLTGVLAYGGAKWVSRRERTPDEKLWDALNDTRRKALLTGKDLVLTIDDAALEKPLSLVARDGDQVVKTFSIAETSAFKFQFLSSSKKGSFSLIGGDLVESGPLARVTFYSDGTCSPFRLQITYGTDSQVVAVDPWTCAPILKEKKGGQK